MQIAGFILVLATGVLLFFEGSEGQNIRPWLLTTQPIVTE